MLNGNDVTTSNQYLIFSLGEENFALTIGSVREVTNLTSITGIPNCPDHLKGVINLRGNIVSVVDLHEKLRVDDVEQTVDTCIVIAEVGKDEHMIHMGIVVDAVKDVVYLSNDQIEPAPKVGSKLNPDYIYGIAKIGDDFIIILDIEAILDTEEPLQELIDH